MWHSMIFLTCGVFVACWSSASSNQSDIAFFAQKPRSPLVKTAYGAIVGLIETSRNGNKYYKYLGIPYASPPVGRRRFKPPEPPASWSEPREATSFGPKCLQRALLGKGVEGDEDCLYLNVYVPEKKRNAKLPVLVYIYGGSFVTGQSSVYGASYFMDEQIILVTFNYRLGALGFLNTGDSVVTGNMGLKDQVMALKWVNKNIEAFGGDPNRVTLSGQSAGAASVHLHILSPQSKGLFSKAIAQSGSALSHWYFYNNPEKKAQSLAARFDCPVANSKEMVACLRKVDGNEIIKELKEVVPLTDKFKRFAPTIETVHDNTTFLSEEPCVLLREGRFNKVPIVSGVNSEEGLIQSTVITANQTEMDLANANFTSWVSKMMDIPMDEKKAKAIRKFYFGDVQNIASEDLLNNYTSMFTDRYFFVPIDTHAMFYSNHTPIRLYYYSFKSPNSLGKLSAATQGRFPAVINLVLNMASDWMKQELLEEEIPHIGTAHGDELPFLYKMIATEISEDSKNYQLSANMVKLWVSFATNNAEKSIRYKGILWPTVSPSNTKYLQIDKNFNLISTPFTGKVKFWKSILEG